MKIRKFCPYSLVKRVLARPNRVKWTTTDTRGWITILVSLLWSALLFHLSNPGPSLFASSEVPLPLSLLLSLLLSLHQRRCLLRFLNRGNTSGFLHTFFFIRCKTSDFSGFKQPLEHLFLQGRWPIL